MRKARIKKLQKQVDALCARHNVLASENSVLKNRAGVLEDLLKVSTTGLGGSSTCPALVAPLSVSTL
jgi:hypothetical protein